MRWSYMEMCLHRKWEYFNKILSQTHLTWGQLEKKRQRRRGHEAEINIEAFPSRLICKADAKLKWNNYIVVRLRFNLARR